MVIFLEHLGDDNSSSSGSFCFCWEVSGSPRDVPLLTIPLPLAACTDFLLGFSSSAVTCLCVNIFLFLLFGVCRTSGICGLVSLMHFGNLPAWISSVWFFFLFFFFHVSFSLSFTFPFFVFHFSVLMCFILPTSLKRKYYFIHSGAGSFGPSVWWVLSQVVGELQWTKETKILVFVNYH